jgi:hypothetical protein
MKRRLIAGLLGFALGVSGCGSDETAEVIATTAITTGATFTIMPDIMTEITMTTASETAVFETITTTGTKETKMPLQSTIVSDFTYEPPESLKNVVWYSEYKEKEIKYEFYKNDENITKHLPQEIVHDFSAYVQTQETDPLTWFGVMTYDMNDDGDEDYLVLARTKWIGDNTIEPFVMSAHDFSAIYLKSSGNFKRIDRFTLSHFTYTGLDGNDGFVSSTKTNGIKDIFLEFNMGYSLTYDGRNNYNRENIDFANIFFEHEKLNDNLCEINLKTMNFDGSEEGQFENGYYVYMRLDTPNPFGYDVLYSSDITGKPIVYKEGFPADSGKTTWENYDDFMRYYFYAPINDLSLYNELYYWDLGVVEIKYVSVDTIDNAEALST